VALDLEVGVLELGIGVVGIDIGLEIDVVVEELNSPLLQLWFEIVCYLYLPFLRSNKNQSLLVEILLLNKKKQRK
jgi:hypothetical protein